LAADDASPPVAISLPRDDGPQCSTMDLAPADVIVDVTATSAGPHSGVTYPVAWTLHVERQSLVLTVSPVLEDLELDTRQTLRLAFLGRTGRGNRIPGRHAGQGSRLCRVDRLCP